MTPGLTDSDMVCGVFRVKRFWVRRRGRQQRVTVRLSQWRKTMRVT